VKDSDGIQVLQCGGLPGETLNGVERFQNYGFTSVPLQGAQVLLLSAGGLRDNPIAIVVNDPRFRPTGMQPGDTAMYDHRKQIVKLTEDGITAETDKTATVKAGEKTVLDCPDNRIGSANASKQVVHEDLAALVKAEVEKCFVTLSPGPPPITLPIETVGAFLPGWIGAALAQKARTE